MKERRFSSACVCVRVCVINLKKHQELHSRLTSHKRGMSRVQMTAGKEGRMA